MKTLLIILALLTSLQSSQAFLFFGDKTKTKTVDEQRHSYDSNAQTVETMVHGERTQTPNVTVAGSNNTATVTIEGNPLYSAQAKAAQANKASLETSDFESYLYKNKLPISVAIFFFAAAIIALCFAIKYARAQSPAVNAAIGFADRQMAGVIEHLDTLAADETDHEKLSRINNLRARLEKNRGKIRAYDPKAKHV